MIGYLRVMPVSQIERERKQKEKLYHDRAYFLIDELWSSEGLGWIPLTAAIKQGNVLKVSAEENRTHHARTVYDALFDMSVADEDGILFDRFLYDAPTKTENGRCEIRGGLLACIGTFVGVGRAAAGPAFKLAFTCLSSSGDGRSLLRGRLP